MVTRWASLLPTHPGCQACDGGDLPHELLHLLDSEGLALAVEWLEELLSCCHKCWWDPHLKLACVNDLSQHFVEIRHHHFLCLLERNGILSLAQLRASKQDEDGFDSCSHSLLNSCSVCFVDLCVNLIVNKHVLWVWSW